MAKMKFVFWTILVLVLFVGAYATNVGGFGDKVSGAFGIGSSASVNNLPGTGGNTAATPSSQCNPNPTITLQYADQFTAATITPQNVTLKINGGNPFNMTSAGSGQISGGQAVQALFAAQGYPTTAIPAFQVGCSTNPVSGKLTSISGFPGLSVIASQNAVASFYTAFGIGTNDTGGGASPLTQTLRIIPTTYNSTGDLILVVDANSSTKVTSITSAYPVYSKGKPNNYVPTTASSKVAVFVIPKSLGQLLIPVTISPASGQNTNNLIVNYTLYQAQDIIDIDGSIVPTQIEDSNGNKKWFAFNYTTDYVQ